MYKRLSLAAMVTALAALSASDAFAQRDAARLGISKPYYGSGGGGGRSGGSFGGGRSFSYGGAPASNYARPVPSYAQPSYSYVQPSYNYVPPQPMIAREPAYRTFSFEPLGINPNDTVVVTRDHVKLMQGHEVVGTVPWGVQFQVTKVINGWLGAVVMLDGQERKGWIWNANVRPAGEAAPTPPTGS